MTVSPLSSSSSLVDCSTTTRCCCRCCCCCSHCKKSLKLQTSTLHLFLFFSNLELFNSSPYLTPLPLFSSIGEVLFQNPSNTRYHRLHKVFVPMAANKFATALHRNSNRIVVILVYTVLEWILIALLLLNSIFSYFITKFASFFGLHPPCLWCSRLDRLLDKQTDGGFYRSLVCDAHAGEISKLGYCSNHRRLAEACGMCEGCSSSRPPRSGAERHITFISLVGDGEIEMGGKEMKCSCCGAAMDDGLYSPYLLLKPAWDVLDYPHATKWIADKEDADHYRDVEYMDLHKDEAVNRGDNEELSGKIDSLEKEEAVAINTEQGIVEDPSRLSVEEKSRVDDDGLVQSASRIGGSPVSDNPLHMGLLSNIERLVTVELIDSSTMEDQCRSRHREDDGDVGYLEEQKAKEPEVEEEVQTSLVVETYTGMDARCNEVEAMGTSQTSKEAENDLVEESHHEIETSSDVSRTVSDDESYIEELEHACSLQEGEGSEERPSTSQVHETISSILELVSQDDSRCGELGAQETQGTQVTSLLASCAVWLADSLIVDREQPNEHDACNASPTEAGDEQKTKLDDTRESKDVLEPTIQVEPIERNVAEEERVPETPTSLDNLLISHKKLFFDRKESGPESLDGSILSDIEGGEVLTIDRLKSGLKAEQKALNALYAELEEERSASAIAANQTMAMITRLQEEKSAMQMEALQYQRMMEEQSEYDQEALQLLNELMVKREKEKQELEKELELYRKKVLHYEAKERMRKQVSSGRSRTSSAACSADDSDELSVDLNEGDESFLGFQDRAQNTPAGEVPSALLTGENGRHLNSLGESLAEFEEERLAILEQLKALEEKLFALSDEEEERYEDVKPIVHLEENGTLVTESAECFTPGENGDRNGFLDESIDGMQNDCHESRLIGSKAKRLLPLFDAIEMEDGEVIFEEQLPSIVSHCSSSKLASSEKKLAIEEEVDHVYERLHALEADREFLKHCINSMKKGDKGIDLLQEILQHLRDLRTVELRSVRNTTDDHI